jgi:hypothetical protein
MAFRVHNASTYDDFDGDDSYNFNEAGLLVIHLGLKGRKADLFATSWTVVEEPDPAGEYRLPGWPA